MAANLPELIPVPNLCVNDAIAHYWRHYATYAEIQALLQKHHNENISIDALKKRRERMGLQRRNGRPLHTRAEIKEAIELLLPQLPETAGYRNVTDTLRQAGLDVRRDTVMEIMRECDMEGVEQRRRRKLNRRVYFSPGPNHSYHMDGYDKLKPYGFAIHGCIDGYSRRIMWLEVNPSNNNPAAVATYFVECIKQNKGCPTLLTSDPGTETTVCAAIQCTLRSDESAHRFVKSTSNQRIEAWWCQLRRNRIEWWIQYFHRMHNSGILNRSTDIDRFALRYTFMPVLKKELRDVSERWNDHYINCGPRSNCPPGRPNILHSLGDDYIQEVCEEEVAEMEAQTEQQTRSGNADFDSYAQSVFIDNGWDDASSTEEAHEQFTVLLRQALGR